MSLNATTRAWPVILGAALLAPLVTWLAHVGPKMPWLNLPPYPPQLGMDLYNGLKVPKELLTCEAAGHCEIANVEPERYYETVTRFVRAPAPQ